jgi:AAA domain
MSSTKDKYSEKPNPPGPKEPGNHPVKLATGEDFLNKELRSKEVLINNLLYRRDLVTLAGRRRNGKTSLVLNLAVALIDGFYREDFLGYKIPFPRRVLAYLLEDDAKELQDKLAGMIGEHEYELKRLAIRTKDDFYPLGLKIDVSDKLFREYILKDVEQFKPDVVIFDNLAHFVGASYNNPNKMHEFGVFTFAVSNAGNCAVITAAHPRKQPSDSKYKPSLAKNRDDFFDEVMGSSQFVNTTGSLWGIERTSEGYSHFLGGTQRLTGSSSLSMIEMDNEGWFQVLNDPKAHFTAVVHTKKRKEAWSWLPEDYSFTYTEAEELCKPILSSKAGFTSFWNDIKRTGLITVKNGGYVAANIPGAVKKTPDEIAGARKENTSKIEEANEPVPDHQTDLSTEPIEKTD